MPTAKGVKIGSALEEMGLAYDAPRIDFARQDQVSPEFLSLNPNNKIPAILDPNGPGGQPLALFESGAIPIRLAVKSGRFLPQASRCQVLQWLMFRMGGLEPMVGQRGYFHSFAGRAIADPRPGKRRRAVVARLLAVLETVFKRRD